MYPFYLPQTFEIGTNSFLSFTKAILITAFIVNCDENIVI